MSKRLQVLLDPKEYKLFANLAKVQGMTLGEWVRQNLRKASKNPARSAAERKRRIELLAAKTNAPTADIDQILAEIEDGRKISE